MKLTEKQIRYNRACIIQLLADTQRKGIENVINYMDQVGFFTAPSSIDRHHCWRGGLAQHSLGVYCEAVKQNGGDSTSSIVLTALLHDLCKGGQFFVDEYGNNRQRHNLHIPGHGGRSVKLLEIKGLELYGNERRAIRWHMHGGKPLHGEPEDLLIAKSEYLHNLIHAADKYDAHYGKHNACPLDSCSIKFNLIINHMRNIYARIFK